ncbi:ABC transporter permease [Agrobacterium vitis]|uniref:ABC transporter permease subunit n=1 Tax=Agrobacterium vitis TaxID=373 RepID=A0ABW9THK8_AGRVI|nr:ABC transporter permease [Agrobacterium vitis]MUO43024.1 ABC transporter permease subunit [Agrobacterium vitis]
MSKLDDVPRWIARASDGPGAAGLERPFAKSMRSLNLSFAIGLAILAVMALLAIAAPWLRPGDPQGMAGQPLLWPLADSAHPLGTDQLGRDILAGVLHGARISLTIGVAAAAISLAVGVAVGATAGYFGGLIDDLIVRFIEIFQTIPSFVTLMVLVAIATPSIETVIIGIALTSWETIARIVRSEFRALRERDFTQAARSVGYGHFRIILREIFPNALPPIIVSTSVMVASAILTESALSFMGLGDSNVVTWGSMIGDGRNLVRTAWYISAIPGAFIVLTVLALNLIGDGLNEILDPRRK